MKCLATIYFTSPFNFDFIGIEINGNFVLFFQYQVLLFFIVQSFIFSDLDLTTLGR